MSFKLLRYNKTKRVYEVVQVEKEIETGKVVFESEKLKPCLVHINWQEIF